MYWNNVSKTVVLTKSFIFLKQGSTIFSLESVGAIAEENIESSDFHCVKGMRVTFQKLRCHFSVIPPDFISVLA